MPGVTLKNKGFRRRAKIETIRDDASDILASHSERVSFDDLLDFADPGSPLASVDVFPAQPGQLPVAKGQILLLNFEREAKYLFNEEGQVITERITS
ncbi:MAG: hypothetical protein ABJH85_01610 [Paracoccaceae bacterium]